MRRRVIIFDDDLAMRQLLWMCFDKRGYEIFTFPAPDDCPLPVSVQCPCPDETTCSDIIISDVHMLGRNGVNYTEELLSKGCKLRHFALMPSDFTETDTARAKGVGCVLFDKPVDRKALTAWVESREKGIPPSRQLFSWADCK